MARYQITIRKEPQQKGLSLGNVYDFFLKHFRKYGQFQESRDGYQRFSFRNGSQASLKDRNRGDPLELILEGSETLYQRTLEKIRSKYPAASVEDREI